MYTFRPETFSAAAAYVQSAQQTSSGGSFLAMFSFDVNLIKGSEDLVPDIVENDFGAEKDLREGKFGTTSLSLGYAYSLIWKKLFLNLTVLLGRGFQTKSFKTDSSESNLSANSSKFSLGASLGYNGDNVYSGISLIQDDNVFTAGSVRISPNLNSTRLFLGIRF